MNMQNGVYHSAGNMRTFREITPKTSTHSDVLAVDIKETLQAIVKKKKKSPVVKLQHVKIQATYGTLL